MSEIGQRSMGLDNICVCCARKLMGSVVTFVHAYFKKLLVLSGKAENLEALAK